MQQPIEQPTSDDLFADARDLLEQALQRLDAEDVRDAAEKAWGATVAAANGLLLRRTGALPTRSGATLRETRRLGGHDRAVQLFSNQVHLRESMLHGQCFYNGICDPLENTESLIRETVELINRARELAEPNNRGDSSN